MRDPEPSPILRAEGPVALVGAGPVSAPALAACLSRAGPIVAADGGAAALRAAGRIPDAVVGDLDSLAAEDAALLPSGRLHRIAEQDSTDFEKGLSRIAAPLVLAVGFLGGRADHALAAMSVLARGVGPPCVVVSEEDAVAAAPRRLALDLAPGTRVSLFPMAPVAGSSEGLRWPVDGIAFAPAGKIGTSNEATGPVRLRMDGPGMLVVVPLSALDVLIEGLAAGLDRGGGRRGPK